MEEIICDFAGLSGGQEGRTSGASQLLEQGIP
jgi:hypothetical protein